MSEYYIADPVSIECSTKHEIENAFNEWNKDLLHKFSVYEPAYEKIKTATERLIRGEYDLMDYKAYKFYWKCLMYKHQCCIEEIDNFILCHPNMTGAAYDVINKIKLEHLDDLIEYTGKYKKAENLVKKPMKWPTKERTDSIKAEIKNYDVKETQ